MLIFQAKISTLWCNKTNDTKWTKESNQTNCIEIFLMTVPWYAPIDIRLHWFWLQDNSIKTQPSSCSIYIFLCVFPSGFLIFQLKKQLQWHRFRFYLSVSQRCFRKRIEAKSLGCFCGCVHLALIIFSIQTHSLLAFHGLIPLVDHKHYFVWFPNEFSSQQKVISEINLAKWWGQILNLRHSRESSIFRVKFFIRKLDQYFRHSRHSRTTKKYKRNSRVNYWDKWIGCSLTICKYLHQITWYIFVCSWWTLAKCNFCKICKFFYYPNCRYFYNENLSNPCVNIKMDASDASLASVTRWRNNGPFWLTRAHLQKHHSIKKTTKMKTMSMNATQLEHWNKFMFVFNKVAEKGANNNIDNVADKSWIGGNRMKQM